MLGPAVECLEKQLKVISHTAVTSFSAICHCSNDRSRLKHLFQHTTNRCKVYCANCYGFSKYQRYTKAKPTPQPHTWKMPLLATITKHNHLFSNVSLDQASSAVISWYNNQRYGSRTNIFSNAQLTVDQTKEH